MTYIYPSVSSSQNDQHALLKVQCDNLFYQLNQIEKSFKHYKKLKHKWVILSRFLHFSKYPIAVILTLLNSGLIFTGVGIIPGIVGIGVTVGEVINSNVLEDTLVAIKINKYHNKMILIKEFIDKMYVYKTDALKDGITDQKEIEG